MNECGHPKAEILRMQAKWLPSASLDRLHGRKRGIQGLPRRRTCVPCRLRGALCQVRLAASCSSPRFRQADTEFEIEGDRNYVTKTYQELKEILGLSERSKPVLVGEQKPTKSIAGKSLGGRTSSPREFIDRYGVKRHVDIVLAFGYFLERLRSQKNFTGADINTCSLRGEGRAVEY